jgi:hypothetical protein
METTSLIMDKDILQWLMQHKEKLHDQREGTSVLIRKVLPKLFKTCYI